MGTTREKENILIIDDDKSIIDAITLVLSDEKFSINNADNGKSGLGLFSKKKHDLVIVDYKMPSLNGVEFIKAAQSIHPDIPIIVMTGHGTKELGIEFLKEGAFRYLEKPFDVEEFKLMIEDGLRHKNLVTDNKTLKNILEINKEFPEIIGQSSEMGKLFQDINQVAKTDATILIQGESGTGKELIAKAIHEKSMVKDGPFIRFNCGALPESLIESELFGHEKGAFTGAENLKLGRFELAQNGSIFLDEIGELSLNMQVKLLRILQEKEFERVGGTRIIKSNTRILAATNRHLKDMVGEKTFREDLFYRLSVFPITVPALRDRKEDIIHLARHFLKQYKKRYNKKIQGFSEKAIKKLEDYQWQGNVRELENIISRAIILCSEDEIREDTIYLENPSTMELNNLALKKDWTEDDLVKYYAKQVYVACDQNKKKTCEKLGISYRTLISRLDEKTETPPSENEDGTEENSFTQLNIVDPF